MGAGDEGDDGQDGALVALNTRRVLSRAWLHLGMACTMVLALIVNEHVWNVATAGMQRPTWTKLETVGQHGVLLGQACTRTSLSASIGWTR